MKIHRAPSQTGLTDAPRRSLSVQRLAEGTWLGVMDPVVRRSRSSSPEDDSGDSCFIVKGPTPECLVQALCGGAWCSGQVCGMDVVCGVALCALQQCGVDSPCELDVCVVDLCGKDAPCFGNWNTWVMCGLDLFGCMGNEGEFCGVAKPDWFDLLASCLTQSPWTCSTQYCDFADGSRPGGTSGGGGGGPPCEGQLDCGEQAYA